MTRKCLSLALVLGLLSLAWAPGGQARDGAVPQRPGLELADFIQAAIQARAGHDAVLQAEQAPAGLEPLIIMALVAHFDLVDNARGQNPADRRQGRMDFMMLKDIDAVREKRGPVVVFSGRKVYDREVADRRAGDVWTQRGLLNLATGNLSLESTVQSQGRLVDRYILEIAARPQGLWLSQFIHARLRPSGGEPLITAVFSRFDAGGYRHIVTAPKAGGFDFTFASLAERPDSAPEAMARGFPVSEEVEIRDGQFRKK